MKTLYESLLDDFDTISRDMDLKDIINTFIDEHYFISGSINISKKANENGLYEVSGKGIIRFTFGEEFTNGLFEWTRIRGDFYCNNTTIQTLEGGPKVVTGEFSCEDCVDLYSLEGAPIKCEDFNCSNTKITSLKGCPQKATGNFYCANCVDLLSLEGAPSVCNNFDCSNTKITTLMGGPKRVKNKFTCNLLKLTTWDGAPKGYKNIEANPNPLKK